ncbi:hypothetical protein IU449_27690 [Nocardia higoensis]|uniref:Uncharacterized protein n=1 Tax=Nocardia higoensis TaxID=228599 RepID=A0ABS0DIJ5_9NOCA|nr:hypothetical protein [Nocardia higoensis]MBF6358285.1 hypothetical protein [Nocardia higoensis]
MAYIPPYYRCFNPWCVEDYHLMPTCPHRTPVLVPPRRPLTQRERDALDHLRRLEAAGELRILPQHWKWWVGLGVAFLLVLLIF